jgi:transposase
MTIPAKGSRTALNWAPEVGEVRRFFSIKKAISYCGLCGAEKSSVARCNADRCPNSATNILQTTLIEAAKMASLKTR